MLEKITYLEAPRYHISTFCDALYTCGIHKHKISGYVDECARFLKGTSTPYPPFLSTDGKLIVNVLLRLNHVNALEN